MGRGWFINEKEFISLLKLNFENEISFSINQKVFDNDGAVIARFQIAGFEVEIFGQNKAIEKHLAYRHLLIEFKLLKTKGEQFRESIIELKKNGMKTEAAFCKLLNLTGDPYHALLSLE